MDQSVPQPDRDDRPDGPGRCDSPDRARPVVLIVDDRPENLVALRRTLRDVDAEIVSRTDGNAALAATLDHDFAVAILDVQMPGMDGYELAALLRGDPKTRRLPIIFLTAAYGAEDQVFRGYEAGAVDYIVKPYHPAMLLAKVNVFLELSRTTAALRQRAEALRQAKEHLEMRVRERTAELQKRAQQLARLTAELSMAEQRERRHLAQVLHDGLQQLLVAARFRLNALESHPDQAVRQEACEIGALVSDSIDTSRSLTAELSPAVLKSGLLPALDWLARWMHEKHGLEVSVEHDARELSLGENVTVLLFQSVRELLFNVVKHAQVKQARIAVSRRGPHVRLVVSDSGVGFDPATQQTARRSGAFGLFAIQERLQWLGGRLEIDAAPGRGSRFTLLAPLDFPAAPADAPAPSPPATPAEPQLAEPARDGRVRIVLADDHAVVRQGLGNLLRLEKQFEVVGEAADGQAAVELVRQCQPDVVLMDVSMPVMDGIEATRILHEECPDVRVIGLSMHDDAHVRQRMRSAGAVAYVTKGGPVDAIVEAIQKAV